MPSIYHRLRNLNPFAHTLSNHASTRTRYTTINNDSEIDLIIDDEQTLRLAKVDPRRGPNNDGSPDDEEQHVGDAEKENETRWRRAWRCFMGLWNWSMHGMMWISMILWALGYVRMEMVMPGVGKGVMVPPELEYKTTITFSVNEDYLSKSTNASGVWESETNDPKRRFLYFQKPEMYSLKQSAGRSEIEGFQKYGVAMYHQLHCLSQIRRRFYDSNPAPYGEDSTSEVDPCFDYLRQSIYCSADLAIEHTIETGMGVEHKCRDMKEVFAFIGKYNEDTAREKAVMRAN